MIDFSPKPHAEAIAIITGKPVVARDVFDGLLPELRGRAFTISGIESLNVMQKVRDSIATLPQGTRWADAKEDIIAELDPFLGDGSDRRAELLLRTHGFQAYQASNWRVAQADDDTVALQYLTMEDDRVRASHAALEGTIVPKNDEFWKLHFPPWEWGCRCRTRTMNPDQVAAAKLADQQRNPEDKLVMEGPALRKLNENVLLRDGQKFDLTPPSQENPDAFQWHPENLRLDVAQIKARYDAAEWLAFVTWAKSQKLNATQTVYDWMNEDQADDEDDEEET